MSRNLSRVDIHGHKVAVRRGIAVASYAFSVLAFDRTCGTDWELKKFDELVAHG
jgi:hypothetical protein